MNIRHPKTKKISASGLLLIAAGLFVLSHPRFTISAKPKVLGLKRVIAFTYAPTKNFDLQQLHSVTLLGPLPAADWKDWQGKKVATGVGHTWTDLLRSPIDKAVDALTATDFDRNPHPLLMIDEFGFDYGGLMDQKSAQVLLMAKQKRPEMSLAVFQMRGPLPKVLAETYRNVADLVMFESYVHTVKSYWWIGAQVWSARRYGVLSKTIVVLGAGKGGNPGEVWADTKAELEQQIRFVRMLAPESPGIGFFGGTPELLKTADKLCEHYSHLPTNGSGLPVEVQDVARTFNRRYDRPTLVASPSFVEPNYKEDGKGLGEPMAMRPYIINLGDTDAKNVTVRLRDTPALGGKVFAEGVIPVIPARSEAVGILRVKELWREWVGQWVLEIDAPGCDVHIYKP